jgi:pectate lyase/pectin methylesterase-like acyl-CoA thioesterase
MKFWMCLVACFTMGAWAQDATRPQVAAAAEADYTVASYLAQGPTPWTPADQSALWGARPDVLVAADGSGAFTSLQAALDAVPAANTGARLVVIGLAAGTYRGQVCLRGKVPVTLIGLGSQPSDVRIVASRYAAESKRPGVDAGNPCLPAVDAPTYGTFSSATLAIFSNAVQLVNLTVENDAMNAVRAGVGYPAAAAETGGAQAVALMTQGDRVQLENVHLLGHQDTLYVRAAPGNTGDRVYVRRSLVAGDVDFIFGAGTLVIDDSTILSRAGRRAAGEGGHVLAPSTAAQTPLGMLVTNSRWISEAGLRLGSVSLGRAWDQGIAKGTWQKAASPNGQAVVRDSVLGNHIGPWAASTSRRPFSATGEQAHRLLEWRNQQAQDWGREILAPQDGWAAAQGGTWGGAEARSVHAYTVRNRSELVAALAPGVYPRVVRVEGRIDLSTNAEGRSLGFADYRDAAFDLQAFVAAYDPATWGKKPPAGPQEEARQRSARKQAQQVVVKVPSHTTLVGVGTDAAIVNGGLALDRVDNVIIRNIHFSDAYDYFPAWDPKDNANGEWNSEYDNLSLRGATRVWIDHCTFDDGPRPDHAEPVFLGRQVQHHDGLLDISHQSNWVTVSWNHFHDHDKTTLVGGSDAQVQDAGKLKVTFHHNWYQRTKERTPRVRYGDVHVYNNLFEGSGEGGYPYAYSLGIGLQSRIFSERNVWLTPPSMRSAQLLRVLKGNRFFDSGSTHNGVAVDLLSALRVNHPGVNWADDVGWTPSLFLAMDLVSEVQTRVQRGAGAGRTPSE